MSPGERRPSPLPPALRELPRGRRMSLSWLMAAYAAAGVGHLLLPDAFARIVPPWVPAPHAVVAITGVCELLGAAALSTRRFRIAAGWALAAYALCVWPANIYHAMLDAGGGGLPTAYHVLRLPLQPLIVWWALAASGALAAWRRPR